MIKIGKIVNTHGIKGEMRIRSNSDFKTERFGVGNKIYVEYKKEKIVLEIINYYQHKTFDIVKFEGYDNINDVIKFKNCDVYADLLSDDSLEEDEYFNYQLLDLKVQNQENETLGKVVKVIDNPGSNLLRIRTETNQEFLVPFNKHFINKVDLNARLIEIEEIEGLR